MEPAGNVRPSVELPVPQVEVLSGSVYDLDELRAGGGRSIHDFADDERADGIGDGTGVFHAHRVAGVDQRIAKAIHSLQDEAVDAGIDHDTDEEIRGTGPGHRVGHSVQGHGLHANGRGAGEHDQIVRGAEAGGSIDGERRGHGLELAQQECLACADVGLDGVHRVEVDVHVVSDQGAGARVDEGIEGRIAQGTIHQVRERAPIRAHDGGRVEHGADARVARRKERFVGRPAQAEAVVDVPGHVDEAVGRPVEIVVLAAFPAVAVVVANGALDGEVAHPRLPIHHRAQRVEIDGRAGRIIRRADRVDELENLRVIVGGRADVDRAFAELEAVGSRQEGRLAVDHGCAAGKVGVVVVGDIEAVAFKLEPVLDLEQLAARVVGKPFPDHVPVRPAHRRPLDTVARDQLMRLGHDVACHCTLHT